VPIPLWLHHMNPMFVDRPPFFVQLTPAQTLMVPVAKDGQLPPADWSGGSPAYTGATDARHETRSAHPVAHFPRSTIFVQGCAGDDIKRVAGRVERARAILSQGG
jgi:hypothetical protein